MSETRQEAREELRRIEEAREPVKKARLQELGRAAEVIGIDMAAQPPYPTDLVVVSKLQFASPPPLIFGEPLAEGNESV